MADKDDKKREQEFSFRLWRYDGTPGELIPLLQSAQEHFGYIPRRAIKYIAEVTGKPESSIYGVITFYSQFRLTPMGKHIVRICVGTACHVSGAQIIVDAVQDELGIEVDGTTEDALFTLFTVACLGCCSLAPVMMVDGDTYGQLTPAKARKIIKQVRREEKKRTAEAPAPACK
jgi:NADH-quinone oxidoreductase subunit E